MSALLQCILASQRDLAYFAQTSINEEICSVDKAALIAGQEEHRLGLFDGLAESTAGEVHLTTESLSMVIAQPVLEQRGTVER